MHLNNCQFKKINAHGLMFPYLQNIESFVFGSERIEEKAFYTGRDLCSKSTLIMNDVSKQLALELLKHQSHGLEL